MKDSFSLLDSIPMGAFVVSREYTVLYWNLCMEEWTELRASEAVGRDLRVLYPKLRDKSISSRLETVFGGGPPVILSYQLHGDLFPTRRSSLVPRVRQCVASAMPGIDGALFTVEDRTDIAAKSREASEELARREAVERELRAAIEERDTLMRELNHRVKNNLHMVQSLIGLESSALDDGPARERLVDLEARVNSIASLHESLYKLDAGSEIRADEYLASIAERLFSALSGKPGQPRLELRLAALSLPSERILYLGLAVNELLTNAIKYGGPRISLSLAALPEGGIEARVADDGPGFPTPIPMRHDALGLRLVEMFAKQMDGSFEADGSSGGSFRLLLPGQ
jgi:two-component sensor histidine kinase